MAHACQHNSRNEEERIVLQASEGPTVGAGGIDFVLLSS